MKTMRQENINSATKTYRSVWWLVLVLAFAVAGCGGGSSKTPPKQQVQNAVAAVLPPFLSLDSIELEPISTGPESVKINFKAIVAPKEGLYQVDREVDGTPKVTLLKMVQAAGTKVTLYGFVEARRMMDKWTLDSPLIQIGVEQFGKPRGSFAAQSYVTGTDEANAALRQQTVNAELQEQARKAALERQERERIAREEQQAREEQALREQQERNRIALEAAQKETAAKRKIEAEKQKMEEQKQTAKNHVEKMERLATEAEQDAQRREASAFGGDAKEAAKGARQRANAARKLAEEARKEYEVVYPGTGLNNQ